MKRALLPIVFSVTFLSGCGGVTNGNSYTPPQTNGNTIPSSKIQLAVGTAALPDGTTGLNVVSTFRQTNGLSATLVNAPSIVGPSGFVVPASSLSGNGQGGSGTDAGTNSITALLQSFQPGPTTSTTFGVVGGDFASGLGDFNNDTNSGTNAFFPGQASGPSPAWGQPFYVTTIPNTGALPSGVTSVSPQPYIVGPPAVPFFDDNTFPQNFAGYMSGFTAFEATPVSGTYTINDTVQTSTSQTFPFSATATLTSLTPLPHLPAPTFAEDGNGGGTATIVVPSDPRVVETLVYVVDVRSGSHNLYYTSAPIKGTGTLTFVLPDNLGICTVFVPNCETSNPGKSITTGDQYLVYAATFDYPQFEAEPPGNTNQTPTISGSAGQADLSLSPALSGVY